MADFSSIAGILLVIICSFCFARGIRVEQFYPRQDGHGSSKLLSSSVSAPIPLGTTYNVYGKQYKTLRVHLDGIITLGSTTIPDYPHIRRKFVFPPYVTVIAPFYAPASLSNGSQVSFYESRDVDILSRAMRDVQSSFIQEGDFNATAVFVVTWVHLKHAHHRQVKKNNTFQAVLITDSKKTFVLFNYDTDGLQWTKGYHIYWKGQRFSHAQSGFSAGDFVRYYTLPNSGEDSVHFLSTTSNRMSPGQWIFKVGWPHMFGMEVQLADSYVDKTSEPLDFFVGQFFKGCFVVHGYLTTNRSQIWKDISIRSCMILCHQHERPFAALHNGDQCACLENLKHLVEASADKCNATCTVNDLEYCGGRYTASVYKVNPRAAVQSDQSSGDAKQKDLDECQFAGGFKCHSAATCVNKSPGFCCHCNDGFYGNGDSCVKMGAVQRMSGPLTGLINNENLGDLKMDVIAFSVDGRAYASVRSFPSSLAYSVLILTPLSDVVSWMYAKPKPNGFINGLSVVGVKFGRRAVVRFDSGEQLGIYQKFKGIDIRTDVINVETEIRGTLPKIDPQAIVNVKKVLKQEFKRTGEGRMQSRGTVKYEVDGTERTFTVDQFIEFNERKGCGQHVDIGVLESEPINLQYNPAQAYLVIAVRSDFINGTLNSLNGDGEGSAKACGSKKITCHKSGVCIDFRNDKECRCNYGYIGDGVTYCNDADECSLNRYRCSKDANCVNTIGSYKCVCKEGYKGDGQQCRIDKSKQCEKPCGANAKCMQVASGPTCICNLGYQGDGFDCKADGTCDGVKCDVNAQCMASEGKVRMCVCKKGYQGDGQKCSADGTCDGVKCDVNAQCTASEGEVRMCVCKKGYQGDGQNCTADGTCDGVKCDVNAQCIASDRKVRICVCKKGYQGDGQKCSVILGGCGGVECHKNARCLDSKCACRAGYVGNGQSCEDENECETKNNSCDPNAVCLNSVGTYGCECKDGYKGDGYKCEKDLDYCGGERCHRFATCEKNPASNKLYCKCRLGFRGDGVQCADFNECIPLLKTCDSNAMCRNTLGSYECLCKRGYVMEKGKCVVNGKCNGQKCNSNAHCNAMQQCICNAGFKEDGKQCADVDECSFQPSRCDPNALCRNTAGSFSCSCKSGFEGDGFRCRADNTCDGEICHARARCVVKDGGSRRCVCGSGYQGNGTSCSDEDECKSKKNSCPDNSDCVNTVGSYKCNCRNGFYQNGSVCTADHICHGVRCIPNARCVQVHQNIRECRCRPGWENDGEKCVDKDECSSEVYPCHPRALCTNTRGSFYCNCGSGYYGNGLFCNDINECRLGRVTCQENAACVNTEGSYECRCKQGFIKSDSKCIKDTTCDGKVCDVNAKCLQSFQGVRECVCNPGWEKDGDKCKDRDECRFNVNPCHPKADCSNSQGSYTCTCRPGYQGDGSFCEADGTCAGINCHPDAICKQNTALGDKCECIPGYLGDGRKCADIDECAQNKDSCHDHATCQNTAGSFKCKCNLGYVGDGFNCTDDGTCQGVRCDVNAKCIATSPTSDKKTCVCNDGFRGSGAVCNDIDECTIGHAKCHRKAECVNQIGSYRCRCNRGYVGDGKQCLSDGTCEGRICDFNAACITTNTSKGLVKTCQCKKGFDGDGILCTDINECENKPCPDMSMCINAFGTFTCICKSGYRKVNGHCERICRRCYNGGLCVGKNQCKCPKGFSGNQCQWYGEASLIYTKGNTVQRMSLPPRPGAIGLVFHHEGMLNVGLDYDCVDEYIYWTEVVEGCIMRAKYDGTGREVVFERSQVRSPEGIAVDWIGRNLYWTDSALDVIEVSGLNGSNRRALVSNGLDNPRAILVDPPNGRMYWSDWTRRRPRIEVANMDGTNRRVLVYHDLVLPNGLTLVQSTNELCYTDAGSLSIQCVDLGGLSVRKVLSRIVYPFGIAYYNRTLYWSTWNQNAVNRIGVNSDLPESPLKTFVGMNGKVFDLKAVQPCPAKAASNPCEVDNGGCLGLCLLKAHGYSCLCPNGQYPVRQGNKTICKAKCDEPMGIENGLISDAQLTASSARFNNNKRFGAHRARLNLESWPAGWSAKTYDPRSWLQIDFGVAKTVSAIATQGLGHSTSKEWVKTFKVAVSDDEITWFILQSNGREKIFIGNSDSESVKRQKFPTPVKTRWLRILPRTWHNHVTMRIELYGC